MEDVASTTMWALYRCPGRAEQLGAEAGLGSLTHQVSEDAPVSVCWHEWVSGQTGS